jgi:endonuclease YncB( thermonuclease family)
LKLPCTTARLLCVTFLSFIAGPRRRPTTDRGYLHGSCQNACCRARHAVNRISINHDLTGLKVLVGVARPRGGGAIRSPRFLQGAALNTALRIDSFQTVMHYAQATHEVVVVHSADRIGVVKLPNNNSPMEVTQTTAAATSAVARTVATAYEEVLLADIQAFTCDPSAVLPQTPMAPGGSSGPLNFHPHGTTHFSTTPKNSPSTTMNVASSLHAGSLQDTPNTPGSVLLHAHDARDEDFYPDGQLLSIEARDYLRRHYVGKRVVVERPRPSRFVHIFKEGSPVSASVQLVSQGLAVPRDESIRGGSDWRDELERAQEEAQAQRRGQYSFRPVSERTQRVRRFPLTTQELTRFGRFYLGCDSVHVHNLVATRSHGPLTSGRAWNHLNRHQDQRRQAIVATVLGQTQVCWVESLFESLTVRLVNCASGQELFLRLAGFACVHLPQVPSTTGSKNVVIPASPSELLNDLHQEALTLLRAKIMHRAYHVSFDAFDDANGTFVGSFAQQIDGLEWLLAHGRLAVDPRTIAFAYRADQLRHLEATAVADHRGLWADGVQQPAHIASTRPFRGIVIGVPSPTTLVVMPDTNSHPEPDTVPQHSVSPRNVVVAFAKVDEPRVVNRLPFGLVLDHSFRYLDARELARQHLLGMPVMVHPISVADATSAFSVPVPSVICGCVTILGEDPVDVAAELVGSGLADPAPLVLAPMSIALQPPACVRAAFEHAATYHSSLVKPSDVAAARYANAEPVEIADEESSSDGDELVVPQNTHSVESLISIGAPAYDAETAIAVILDPFASAREVFQISLTDASDHRVGAQPKPNLAVTPPVVTATVNLPRPSTVEQPLMAPQSDSSSPRASPAALRDPEDLGKSTTRSLPAATPADSDTIGILFVKPDSRSLRRPQLPWLMPLEGSIEFCRSDSLILHVHLFGPCVVVPITPAGAHVPRHRAAQAAVRMQRWLHRRVTVRLTEINDVMCAFTALITPPDGVTADHAPTLAVDLIVNGDAFARELHLLGDPTFAVAHHQAEAVARKNSLGLWGMEHEEATNAALRQLRGTLNTGLTTFGSSTEALGDVSERWPGYVTPVRLVGTNPSRGTLVFEDVPLASLSHDFRAAADLVPTYQFLAGVPPSEPIEGAHCLVHLASEWHRGRVLRTAAVDSVVVKLVDLGREATVQLADVHFLDAAKFNKARAEAFNGRHRPRRGRGRKPQQPQQQQQRQESEAADALPVLPAPFDALPVANAMALLLDTPPAIFEGRIAFVDIVSLTPRVGSVLDFLSFDAATAAAPPPVAEVTYTRDGIPYLAIFRNEERRAAGHPPITAVLLSATSTDEVVMDLSLLDEPAFVDALTTLIAVPRVMQDSPMVVPTSASGEGPLRTTARGRGRGRGTGSFNARGRGKAKLPAPRSAEKG